MTGDKGKWMTDKVQNVTKHDVGDLSVRCKWKCKKVAFKSDSV